MVIFNISLLFLVFFRRSLASYQKSDNNNTFNDASKLSLNNFNPIQPKNLVQSILSPHAHIKLVLNPYALQINPYTSPVQLTLNSFNLPTQLTFTQSPQNFQYKPYFIPHVPTLSGQTCFQQSKNLLEPKVLHLAPPTLLSFKSPKPQPPHLLNNSQNCQSNLTFDEGDQIFQNQQLLVQTPQNQQLLGQLFQNNIKKVKDNQNTSQAGSDDAHDVSHVDSNDDNNDDHAKLLRTQESKKVNSDENVKRLLASLFDFHPTDLPKYEFVGKEFPLGFRELSTIKNICAFGDTVIIFEKSPKNGPSLISYKCNVCDRVIKDRYKYCRHADVHRNVRRYKCNLCSKKFTHKRNLNAHEKRHFKGFKFKCSICNLPLTSKSDQIAHEKAHVDPTK